MFLWHFAKTVAADARMKSNISNDIPAIIMKAVLAFKALVKDAYVARMDVTDYVAERTSYFQDVLKEMDTSMSMRLFFGSSSTLLCHPAAFVRRDDLNEAYTLWCQKFTHKPQPWNTDNVADAISHLESKEKTNRAGSRWDKPFSLLPKNDVGYPKPGTSERCYFGFGLHDVVLKNQYRGRPPVDNPFGETSRQRDRAAENREAAKMAAEVDRLNQQIQADLRAERAARHGPEEDEHDDQHPEENGRPMATRFL